MAYEDGLLVAILSPFCGYSKGARIAVQDSSVKGGSQEKAQPMLSSPLPNYAMDFTEPPKAYEEAVFFELIIGVQSSSATTKTIYHFLVFLF